MKERRRSILHVDLDPFFVSVERNLDPSLVGRPLIIGGDGQGMGFVAVASEEARAKGVRVGQPLTQARTLCPDAAFRRGDLDAYGHASQEVTAVLLAASRRVERPSADEAFVDLTPEGTGAAAAVRAAETIRDELQRRLRLDVSLGLASSRLAARVASGWAKPRGLLVVLPGYERSFLSGKPVSALGLPPHLELALERAGFTTLGQIGGDEAALDAAVGAAVAARLQAAARGEGEPPVSAAAPPSSLQEETTIRDKRTDRVALQEIVDALARRVARRLKPFRLSAGALTVEVRRAAESLRRSESFSPGLSDAEAISSLARTLAEPLIDPAEGVRAVLVRLSRLEPPSSQAPLFPQSPAVGHGR